jgi:hypothetical protein
MPAGPEFHVPRGFELRFGACGARSGIERAHVSMPGGRNDCRFRFHKSTITSLSESESPSSPSQQDPTTAAARNARKKRHRPLDNVHEESAGADEAGAVRPGEMTSASPPETPAQPPPGAPRPNDVEAPRRPRMMPARPVPRQESPREFRPERGQPPRGDRYLDIRELSEKAWQLFAGELREEGIELIDEHEAERLTSRCFRLAEVFMRTRARRINQLQHSGTTAADDRRREEQKPKPQPIERPPARTDRVPGERAEVSREQAEAIIEEARAAAAEQGNPPESPAAASQD